MEAFQQLPHETGPLLDGQAQRDIGYGLQVHTPSLADEIIR